MDAPEFFANVSYQHIQDLVTGTADGLERLHFPFDPELAKCRRKAVML